MKRITIYQTSDNEVRDYKVHYSHNKEDHFSYMDEVQQLLNMRQKEDFFMGKYIFMIDDYDFTKYVLPNIN